MNRHCWFAQPNIRLSGNAPDAISGTPDAPHTRVVLTGTKMLWTILVVLCVLWLLGMVTSYTLGGFIHILLLVALAIFVINLIQGRRRMV